MIECVAGVKEAREVGHRSRTSGGMRNQKECDRMTSLRSRLARSGSLCRIPKRERMH